MHLARSGISLTITLTITIIFAASSCAKSASFEDTYRKAKRNAATAAGADYDHKLTKTMHGAKGLPEAFGACLAGDFSQTSVHGYIVIRSPNDYTIVTEPKGKLSECISKTFGDQTLPVPPTIPYLYPFEFSISKGPPV